VRRHELSDARRALVAGFMPAAGHRGGGRWRDHRQVANGLARKLRTGAPWRDLRDH
jgi:transposase